MTRTLRPAAGLFAATLSLALAGCKIDDRPLLAWGRPAPPEPYAGAPAPGPLDPTYVAPATTPALAAYPPPVRAYAYPQRAYLMSRAVYGEPPSYAFGYGGEEPWAWDVADQGEVFAEPADNGWRYYYYEPDEPYPYFVQDAAYGYAYGDGGALIAIFDAAGALLSADQYAPLEYRARDWWRRGYDLDEAYQRTPRHRVDETVWRQRAPVMTAQPARWFQAASVQPAWRQAEQVGAAEAIAHDHGRKMDWRGAPNRQIALAAPLPGVSPQAAFSRPGSPAWRAGERPWRPAPPSAQTGGAPAPRRHAPAPRDLAHAPPHGPAAPPRFADAERSQAAWRDARQGRAPWTPPAQHVPRPQTVARGPQGPGGERPAPQAFARMEQPQPPHEARRPGGGHPGGGPPPVAVAAQAHGAPAAWHAPAPAPGPPPPHPRGSGGGGGGGQPAPAGGPHGGNPGGGHGGGQNGHGHAHG